MCMQLSFPFDLAPTAQDRAAVLLAGIAEKVEGERFDHDANAEEGGRDLDP